MTLYHYVPSKDELVRLMAEAVFAFESLPDPGPGRLAGPAGGGGTAALAHLRATPLGRGAGADLVDAAPFVAERE